jgi:hypothetical protein
LNALKAWVKKLWNKDSQYFIFLILSYSAQ